MRTNYKRGVAPVIIAIIAALVVGGGAVAIKKNSEKKAERALVEQAGGSATSTKVVHITLNEQNSSGQKGKAILFDVKGKAKVIVTLKGKPSDVAQPAHIHLGSCATIGTVKYALANVTKGASMTSLNVSVADILKSVPLAINVHKSAAESSVYTSCGDITASTKAK
ncbi:hypothetical protein KW782_03705 [Candidatus Parcubacteria bacterium]|nr:hypothetical protein [Candidatus Parcubacteria bacterium]